VQRSVLHGHRQPGDKTTFYNEKKAHDSPLAEELARDYALYKLAALYHIAHSDPEFVLTARLAACQNQVF
jgi:hypothetical protein